MHRGHSWVFRAESHDTMMAWYDDIRSLTEKSGEEKRAFMRRHARSHSLGSHMAPSVSSDGLDEDEADKVPYSADAALLGQNSRTATMTTTVTTATASTETPTNSTIAATAGQGSADTRGTSATTSLSQIHVPTVTVEEEQQTSKRPSPGGRFPSDVNVELNLDLRTRRLSSSGGSSNDTVSPAGDVSNGQGLGAHSGTNGDAGRGGVVMNGEGHST